MKIAIIGGGAAGMMCAATIAERNSEAEVFLIERNAILGHKVIISGGGRCNVTTGIQDLDQIMEKYPRGRNFLKFAMYNFSPEMVFEWFEAHGVPLKIEADLRVFPKSNNGKDVVRALENVFGKSTVQVLLQHKVEKVEKSAEGFAIEFDVGEKLVVDKLVITTGGQAYKQTGSTGDGYSFAENLGHSITDLAPSLNALVLKEEWVKELAGVSFKNCRLKISAGKQYEFHGPFVFTHKGISGPAIFALSSMAAHELSDADLQPKLVIDFIPESNYEEVTAKLKSLLQEAPKKNFINALKFFVPKSVAEILCRELGFKIEKLAAEIGKSEVNKAVEWLKNLHLNISGFSAGEEFVTAGGVQLSEVDAKTMQSRICPGLYFAGEILDIDGFTGGFNLQAAWTTGRLAGENAGQK